MGVLAPARPRANITVRRTARPRQAHTLPTPGTHHAHARRTARTRQPHSTHTPRTRKQLHTYTRTTAVDHEHASGQSAPGMPTTTSTQAHIHAHNSRQARIAWAMTGHCPHIVHDAQAGRRSSAPKQTPTSRDVATSTRPRLRPQHTAKTPPATTPTHAHKARWRARTPTPTDAHAHGRIPTRMPRTGSLQPPAASGAPPPLRLWPSLPRAAVSGFVPSLAVRSRSAGRPHASGTPSIHDDHRTITAVRAPELASSATPAHACQRVPTPWGRAAVSGKRQTGPCAPSVRGPWR
jgi:hypothetical protein